MIGEPFQASSSVETPMGRAHGRDGKNLVVDGASAALLEQAETGVYQVGGDRPETASCPSRDGLDRAPTAARLSLRGSPLAAPSLPSRGASLAEVTGEVTASHAREAVETDAVGMPGEFPESIKKARILAVDIGASGAAALLDEAGDLLDVVDLPVLEAGPACRPEISPHLLAAIVRRWAPDRAWVEWIGPRAGDQPRGSFAFGASKATVETTLAVLGVPFRTITPATWKRAAGIPAGKGLKDLARARAIERWPGHADLFGRKLDHDRAEASLIGWAGLQREKQGR